MGLLKTTYADKLKVLVFETREEMGNAAGKDAADFIRNLLTQKEEVNIIFAAAPSQNETLDALVAAEGIEWNRINAFHMDEYLGLDPSAPQGFGNFLTEHMFSRVPFKNVYRINPAATDAAAECARYTELLKANPVDMVCLGIGENAHLAFNDPGFAKFDDTEWVKVVELDETCRMQQVHDGCFASIDEVPTHALTLTIPTLMRAAHLVCTVPAASKQKAVALTVEGEISESVPSTAMRKHKSAVMYCDAQSGADVKQKDALNVAFVGVRHSHIFAMYDEMKAHPGFNVVGAWEEDENSVPAGKRRIKEQFFDSYEEILQNPDIDAIAIGDYYGIRGKRAIDALKAGKAVIADKPLCTSLKELKKIEKLSKEKNIPVGCWLNLKEDPALRRAAEIIKSGELGEIKAFNFTAQHPLNYGSRPRWYFEKGKHCGTFNDIAIHAMDAVKYITGYGLQKTLFARQWNAFATKDPEFLDSAHFSALLQNGAAFTGDVSYAAPSPMGFSLASYWRFTLWCSEGWLEFKCGVNEVKWSKSGDSEIHIESGKPCEETVLEAFLEECNSKQAGAETQLVINATRSALKLQAFADKK